MFIPEDQVEWREVGYLRPSFTIPNQDRPVEFMLQLPVPLAEWDVFEDWERERTKSMQANLKQGDVLFDIGAEHGWLSVVYAGFVGAENMFLIEPTPEFWPNIKATWGKNGLVAPRGTWNGLVGSKNLNWTEPYKWNTWPREAFTGHLIDRLKYIYIHEHGNVVPQITIDTMVQISKVVPRALTMDTEGAEHLILEGAIGTLTKHKPLVWVSIHPELALRDYKYDVAGIHAFMKKLGYSEKYLATDHEEHWLFYPKGIKVE